MRQTFSRLGILLVVFTLVASVMTGGVAADYSSSPALDASGTDDTGSQSELNAGGTLGENHTFAASSTANTTIQWIAATNNTAIEISKNGSSHMAYRNASAQTVTWNSTDSDGHFNATVVHDTLADVEHAAGGNTTMDLVSINNTSVADSNQTTTLNTFYIEWDNSTSTQVIDDSDVSSSDIVTVKDENGSSLGPVSVPFSGEDNTEIETKDRSVNGSTTDVVLVLSNSTVMDDFDAAASDASDGAKLSGIFSTTRTVGVVSSGEDTSTPIAIYNSEAPDSVDNDTTYGVYKSVGGEQALVVNLGDTYSDADSVSVHAFGNAGALTFAWEYISSSTDTTMSMSFGAGFGVLFIGTRTSRRRRTQYAG